MFHIQQCREAARLDNTKQCVYACHEMRKDVVTLRTNLDNSPKEVDMTTRRSLLSLMAEITEE